MTNTFRTLVAAAATALLVPAIANATTLAGRVTSFSPTSITVMDNEMVTVGINDNTVFTKLITQKPWQQDTALTAKALRDRHATGRRSRARERRRPMRCLSS